MVMNQNSQRRDENWSSVSVLVEFSVFFSSFSFSIIPARELLLFLLSPPFPPPTYHYHHPRSVLRLQPTRPTSNPFQRLVGSSSSHKIHLQCTRAPRLKASDLMKFHVYYSLLRNIFDQVPVPP